MLKTSNVAGLPLFSWIKVDNTWWKSVFFCPGRVRPAETRQPPGASLPGTFSHQILPAGASPAQPAQGTNPPPLPPQDAHWSRWFLSPHWFLSMLPSGHHGRADAGRVGEVHHGGAQSVQCLDSLRHPAGALSSSIWKWTTVLPGCCLETKLQLCFFYTSIKTDRNLCSS